MTREEFQKLAPNASASTLAANGFTEPQRRQVMAENLGALIEKQAEERQPNKTRGRRKPMNKTEARMAEQLEAQRQAGEIMRFEFEGMSLRWGGTETASPMVYTPDFVVITNAGKLRLIEVKGGFIRDRDVVRFKGCRACWPFEFQMWQWKDKEWRQLH